MSSSEIVGIAWFSVWVSLVAVVLAGSVGLPLGYAIATGRFLGRALVVRLLNTLMAMPTVVVGLLAYMLLSRRGPLGPLGLLHSPGAIVLGETVLILPLIIFLTLTTIEGLDRRVRETALTLGASRWQATWAICAEARFGLMAALIAGFGRAVGEVGVAMMLGGNIRHFTRTMTTTIALETSKGELRGALVLGAILLGIAFAVNAVLGLLQGQGREAGPV